MARGAPRPHTAAMVAKKRAIVYLDLDLHRALRTESAKKDLTVSELVNIAVRTGLADAADDLATFGKRAQEPSVSFRRGARGKARPNRKRSRNRNRNRKKRRRA
jgi:hypothetical protein